MTRTKRKKIIRRIGLALIFTLLAMQLIPSGLKSQDDYAKGNIMFVTDHEFDIDSLLIKQCMDCHSGHTVRPWYFGIRPLTFFLVHHVNEGREHLNFDDWSVMDRKEQLHALEECIEEVEEGHMPLKSYTYTHPKLSSEERETLLDWFKSLSK